jgi:hypothetical protein
LLDEIQGGVDPLVGGRDVQDPVSADQADPLPLARQEKLDEPHVASSLFSLGGAAWRTLRGRPEGMAEPTETRNPCNWKALCRLPYAWIEFNGFQEEVCSSKFGWIGQVRWVVT